MKKIYLKLKLFLFNINIYNKIPDIELGDFETDAKAIHSDWQAIGNDFKTVFSKLD